MSSDLFTQRPEITPTIYAYELVDVPSHKGLIKIGYTDRDGKTRVEEQLKTSGVKYHILFSESAMYSDGGNFKDHAIHNALDKMKKTREHGEWYSCTVADVQAAYIAVRDKTDNIENRNRNFKMRPEQIEAVKKTIEYFNREKNKGTAKFLWNAKMRFGKTFASYQLAKQMGLSKILVLTFKPAVQDAWEEDITTHIDFEGWQFISRKSALTWETANKSKPIVCFGSFQDYLGT